MLVQSYRCHKKICVPRETTVHVRPNFFRGRRISDNLDTGMTKRFPLSCEETNDFLTVASS